jgi:hypothetical protein
MEEKSLDSAFWTVQSFARQPQTPQYEEVASAQMVSARRHKQHLPRPLKGKTERSLNLFQVDREKSTNDPRALVETPAASDICGWHLAVVGRRPS